MMEAQKVTHRRRRRTPAEIEQIVSEFESGDLTQAEFCRRQGLVLSTLGRYLKQLRSPSAVASDGLVAVELAVKKWDTVAAGCGLSVVVASGRRIVVEAGFDSATLQRLLQVLERM